jgi:hypothetical protein
MALQPFGLFLLCKRALKTLVHWTLQGNGREESSTNGSKVHSETSSDHGGNVFEEGETEQTGKKAGTVKASGKKSKVA